MNIMLDGHPMMMSIWDTASQRDYDRLRPLSYPQTDCFLLCFDTCNKKSLEHIRYTDFGSSSCPFGLSGYCLDIHG
jgi:GTPase SAR1 family protein